MSGIESTDKEELAKVDEQASKLESMLELFNEMEADGGKTFNINDFLPQKDIEKAVEDAV